MDGPPKEEIRLDLAGDELVFPAGRPFCLVCGAEPAGTRKVWFEDLGGGGVSEGIDAMAGKVGALGAGARLLRERVAFRAPLCALHRRRARWAGLPAVGFFLLTVAVFAGVFLLLKRLGVPEKAHKWIAFAAVLPPGWLFWRAWRRKDRGGLPCEVRREEGGVVLRYNGSPPRPPNT